MYIESNSNPSFIVVKDEQKLLVRPFALGKMSWEVS